MNKHYFVTGGNGFIGHAIVKMLLNEGNKVTVFDNISRHSKKFYKNKNYKFIKGDICKLADLNKSLKKVDALVHLAYINGTQNFYDIPHRIIEVAAKGITNIFDACRSNNIKEIYLASSSEVYYYPKKIPTDENIPLIIPDPYNPRYSYGAGKILTEIYGLNFSKFFNKLIIFRPHNVYGPDMGNEHVIPEITNKILKIKNGKLKIQGSGKETRSFIYIDDFVECFKILINKGKHKNIYNIGNNEEVTISYVIKLISKILKKRIVTKKGVLKKGGTLRRCPDIAKIKKIGYKQKHSLELGLKNTVDWYKLNYEKK